MESKNFSQAYLKVLKILEYFHISAAEFAAKIGVSPSKIYDLKRGQIKNFSAEMLEKIVKAYPQINTAWLLTGEGSMLVEGSGNNIVANSTIGGDNNQQNCPDLERLHGIIDRLTEQTSQQTAIIANLTSILANK